MNSYNNDLNQNNPSESKDPAGGYASYPQQNQPYGQTTQQTQQTAYTWPPRQQPMYYPPQPVKPKEKKKGGHFGLKLLAVVLACAVTSFASLGVFVGLIQRALDEAEAAEEE